MNDHHEGGFATLAPAFALGVLGPEEEAGFRVALARSPELQREVSRYTEVAALLCVPGAEVVPPRGVKRRLMARVREQSPPTQPPADRPLHGDQDFPPMIDLDSVSWSPSEFGTGFDVHWLSRNEDSGEMALLLRGAPGSAYPDHAHPGGEHLYVLQGAFADHRAQYATGDSISFPPGSVHRELRVTGAAPCVIVVITGPGGVTPL